MHELTVRSSFSKHVLQWFILATALMAGGGYLTYNSITSLIHQNIGATHTHEVLEAIADAFSQLKEIQSSQRGYIITKQESYLDGYRTALPKIDGALGKLQTLTEDNARQQGRVKDLGAKIHNRLAEIADIITAYRERGAESAYEMTRRDPAKEAMDEIQGIARGMENEERERLAKRTQSAEDAVRVTLTVGGLGIVVYFSLLSSVFWLSRKEGIQREKIEVALKKTFVQLEDKTTETKYVSKIGDFLQSCRTHAEAFPFIADTLARLLPGSSGAIAIINNSHDAVEIVSKWGTHVACGEHFSPDNCWALRRGRAHVIDGTGIEPACTHITNIPVFSLCLPMMAQGVTLGILYICSESPNHVDENKLQTLTTVSEQISLALANLRLQETLRIQSIRDPLTQLFNRRYIQTALVREFSRAKRHRHTIGVLMIDIDHFKRFNDTHGHEAGDLVLTEVSRMLLHHIRMEDIACRYGGEEFLIILPGTQLKDACIKAETLRIAIGQLAVQHNRRALGPITISVGAAEYPSNGELGDVVIAAADAALYQAKNRGRNQVVSTEAMVFSEKQSFLERPAA